MFKIGKKLILTLAIIGAIFGLAACGKSEDVVRVKLDKIDFELIVGESIEVTPIVTKGGVTTEATLGYKSYDESVATYVDGKVTAVAPGETTIKVFDIDHPLAYATATVVVKAAESLNATFSYETSMFKGEEQMVKGELASDSIMSVISYKSANPDIATIDENGKVVAVGAGKATIIATVTASSDKNNYRDYTFEITVVESDYKILYELDGGVNNEANPAGYNVLELPLELAEPTKVGYTFLGWYINDELVTAIAAGTTGDVTVVAKWEKAVFSIKYELDGGQNAEENPSEFTALDLPLTLKDATKTGYTFLGWFNGEEKVTEITDAMLTDLVLTAKWEKEVYTLDMDINGGEFDKVADVSGAKALQEFTLSYYLSYNVNGYDACLHNSVSWGKYWYYISLKETGVNGLYQIVQIVAGSSKLTEDYDLVIGWHDSINVADRKAVLFDMYSDSASYIGQYVALTNVPAEKSSDCNIGVTVYDASTVQILGQPAATFTVDDEVVLPTASKVGYEFVGWFDGETKVEKIEKGTTQSVKLVAKYKAVDYALDLQLDGGVWPAQANLSSATTMGTTTVTTYLKYDVNGYQVAILDAPNPIWWGYVALQETEVAGLYKILDAVLNKNKLTDEVKAAADLYITWHSSCTDTDAKAFLNGMVNNRDKYVNQYVTLTGVPAEATMEANIAVTIYDATTVKVYTEPMTTYTIEDEIVLPELVKEGYEFLGWFDGETKVEKIEKGSTGAKAYTAKWQVKITKHTVSYELNGGTTVVDLPTEYEEGTAITLPTPVKAGYKFLGWFDNAECTGDAVTEISATATTDLKFYAAWEEITVTPQDVIVVDPSDANAYKTIQEAVAVAKLGQVIEVKAGTYDEVVTIDAEGIVLKGANAGVAYNGTRGAETVVTQFVFGANAKNVVVDGFKSESINAVVVNGGQNVAIQNCVMTGTATANGQAMVKIDGSVNGLTIANCSFNANNPSKYSHYRAIWSVGNANVVTNAVIENNSFVTNSDPAVYIDCVRLYSLAGTIDISNNTFDWPGDNFTTFLGGGKFADDTVIIHANNTYKGTNPMSGTSFRGISSATKVYYYGNTFENVKGTAVEIRGSSATDSTTTATVEFKNNAILDTSTAMRFAVSSENVTTSNNYLFKEVAWSGNTMTLENPAETKDAALAGMKLVDVYYTVEQGALHTYVPTKIVEGLNYSLSTAVVVLPGYELAGWYDNPEFTGSPVITVNKAMVLYAKVERMKHNVTFELNEGTCADLPTYYVEGEGLATLPNPAKAGYQFMGWYDNAECTGEPVTSIPTTATTDITLYATWQEAKELIVDPNDTDKYQTIEEAVNAANNGDTIIVKAGTYPGATITKEVIIKGANAGINPNRSTRVEETIFNGDIVVSASNVTIDGIQLTENARIVLDENKSVASTTITCLLVSGTTIGNSTNPAPSKLAPIQMIPAVEGVVYSNVVVTKSRYEAAPGRIMILYGSQVKGLTMTNNEFYGTNTNSQYNDGIKLNGDKKYDYDVCGDVLIKNNKFANYGQYPIWFSKYAEGKYEFINNSFENCAVYTQNNNGCFTMNTPALAEVGKLEVSILYNTAKNSGILGRIQTAGLTADNAKVDVHYNKVVNPLHNLFVSDNGSNSLNLINATDNYYSKTPTAANFKGVSAWEPYYENEKDVPQYIEPGAMFDINYELNGGVLPTDAPTQFNPFNGLADLPVPTQEGMVFLGWMMNDQYVTEIPEGTPSEVTLVAKWREDAIYVGLSDEDWVVPTLAEALAIAKPTDKIIFLPGTYNETVTISIADLTIVGPNEGVNPNKETRKEEAIFTGNIKIAPSATNLTIDGLAFTGDAYIENTKSASYSGFKFMNNKCYDTTETTEAWNYDRYKTTGFIEFRLGDGGATNNFVYKNNLFDNVSATNILSNRAVNLIVEGNVFKDFDRDAFRTAGGYVYGTLLFADNTFEQTTAGNGYHAMFFKALAGSSGTLCTLIIKNNTFKNVGNANGLDSPFKGVISSDFFQENPTDIIIEGNIFDHCYNYLWLRNNGANTDTKRWTCNVKNNQFLGLPHDYYFGTFRGSDSETTNPYYAVFGENYYEDNNGTVITDLTPYANMFKHLATYGTAVSTKPGKAEVEALEFYSISFDADGGSILGSYTTGYTSQSTGTIKLPNASKVNHDFLGWMLDGEIVTEIDTALKRNVKLVAKWQKQEGELFDVTYDFAGGLSNDLLVANKDGVPTLPLNNYDYNNGTFWSGKYTTDIFISTPGCDPGATFSDRIYIGKNAETGLYEVLSVLRSGGSVWAEGAEYVITISNSYQGELGGYYGSIRPITEKISVGQMVAFDKAIETTEAGNPTNVYFFDTKPENDKLVVKQRFTDKISAASRLGFKFLGWYDAEGTQWADLSKLTGPLTLTAKWEQLSPVTSIKVDAICDKLLTGDKFQIVASVQPDDAYFKQLSYESSNTDILVVDANGMITALNAGKATITIWDYLKDVKYEKEITVHAITSVDATFEEGYNGVLEPGQTVQINAEAFGENTADATFTYTSSDEKVLTVSNTGLVTAVAEGTAKVTIAMVGKDATLDVTVVVKTLAKETEIDQLLALLVENNFAVVEAGNISLYNDGRKRVYVPVYGSVNNFLFDAFSVNTEYYATSEDNPNNHQNRRPEDVIEFVTVHDTATLTGTVVSIAQGMSSGETSIHYTVGNDAIYGVVPEKYIAYHAGDGTKMSFAWTKTNVTATQNVAPVITVVEVDVVEDEQTVKKTFLAVNGVTTNIAVPTKTDGTNATTDDLSILGPVWKVEDGYYYVGTPLWWSKSYATVGAFGGNCNSIGIEMCSNTSGDIYDTFQRTAKLVSDILIRNNLDPTRVKMHNTWSGKNCPQTMISGNFWSSFMEMVELEYTINTTYKGAEISIKSNNPEILDNTGRIISAPTTTTTVSYELTVKLGEETRTITLYSVVPGTTTWEQWDGEYNASVIWNNGNFAI